jgi:hypothetical protein
MPTYPDSVSCCNGFAKTYSRAIGQNYQKSDSDIYTKLCRFGNESQAFGLAKKKLLEHERNCKEAPSDMCPATTLHVLVEEIKKKIAEA